MAAHKDTAFPENEGEQATLSKPSQSDAKRKAEWKEVDDEKNTSVYVTGLPTTMTEEEFIDLMKKYGCIAQKPIFGEPYNIKLYKNKDGSLKGDACCKYQRKESVQLAINLLDGYQYDAKHIIHCEKAQFQPKDSFDPSKKPRVDPEIQLRQRKRNDKMRSWEPEPVQKRQKKVVLKHMFTVEQMTEDPSLILSLREILEQRCSRELQVEPKRVDVYDANPDGIVTITFAEPEQAEACVYAFSTYIPQLEAELWDGKTKYKIKETDEEVEKRLKKFEDDIQNTSDDKPKEDDDSSVKPTTPTRDLTDE